MRFGSQQAPAGASASYLDGAEERSLASGTWVITICALMLACFFVWAAVFEVVEVSTGTGKVIPSSREQIIQSMGGGIIKELLVTEGTLVEKNQILAQLDPVQTQSTVGESEAKYYAALASSNRLQAEVSGEPLEFSAKLQDYPDLIAAETALYNARQRALKETLAGINDSLQLVRSELDITEGLLEIGASSRVEVLRLKRQRSELELKANEARSDYLVTAREGQAEANAEVNMLQAVISGRSDALSRLTLRSPVRGIVKDIQVSTIGGVIPPNGQLMQIVPMDEQLLIETRISPRDIAFIHPQQDAKVKITAYDYSIYGGLDGKVVTISPDTIQDEVKPEVFYYRVFIRTDSDSLHNKAGKAFAIAPGMIATVDIRTGEKTILDYLLKPLNRAEEALRER